MARPARARPAARHGWDSDAFMTYPGVVIWSAGGWRGVNAPPGAHPGWDQPGFDDSSWPEVQLPLASYPWQAPTSELCPIHLEYPGQTFWPVGTDYLLRRWVTGLDFTIQLAIDNHVWIYWDGVFSDEFDNEDDLLGTTCPERTDHAPASGDLGNGDHLLAIRVNDRGNQSYFDCTVTLTGDLPALRLLARGDSREIGGCPRLTFARHSRRDSTRIVGHW